MDRRTFLKALVVSAGVAVGDLGCSGEPEASAAPVPPRELSPGEAFFPQSVASGDPRPSSVVLWARVDDPEATGDLTLDLEVARDEAFTEPVALGGEPRLTIVAEAVFDRCVKVKVDDLEAATTYYYRFVYTKGETHLVSRVGRTRTAPAEDADVKVRFAYVSCQDRIGRYYTSYAALAEQEIDFFVHLGDYIYETTGDPSFQESGSDRRVVFSDAASAIALGTEESRYYAARSLSNYRELYRFYRSDALLQAVHEKAPMIATWDDHEFSNDAHGATGTYFNGRVDETDVERRKAANQAWFEYMPVDYREDDFRYDPQAPFPGDIAIWRDFRFGRHVHLVVVDVRTYRSDHVVPEGAFPGTIILDQAKLAALGESPPVAAPYVDIDAYDGGAYAAGLKAAAEAIGYDPAKITGNILVAFINELLPEVNAVVSTPLEPITDTAGLERGLAYLHLGKSAFYSSMGSRSLVEKFGFDLYAKVKYEESGGASEIGYGAEQEAWFLQTMKSSTATWKVWANQYCLLPIQVDLRSLPVPASLRSKFYLSTDGWDGHRNRRDTLLTELAAVPNVVAITGDVHAFFAATPHVDGDPTKKIVEITTSSISSGTYSSLLLRNVQSDPTLSQVLGVERLIENMDVLFTTAEYKANPHMGYANSFVNGFTLVEVDGAAFLATLHMIPESEISVDYEGRRGEVASKIQKETFKVDAGSKELQRSFDGVFRRWDMDEVGWV
jgi:alkaline phosphatase D